MSFSNLLSRIAQAETYSEAALRYAMWHPAATQYDVQMLDRYLRGAETSADRFRLQDLAIRVYTKEN